jgi:hypothetical protein
VGAASISSPKIAPAAQLSEGSQEHAGAVYARIVVSESRGRMASRSTNYLTTDTRGRCVQMEEVLEQTIADSTACHFLFVVYVVRLS